MSFKQFDDDSKHPDEIRIEIPEQCSKEDHPKSTLLAQGVAMFWAHTQWWQKILVFFFLALMLVIPLLTNWMNIQMVQGSIQSFSILFCIIRILRRLIDVLRDCFLLHIGTKMQALFVKSGLAHYASLSKPTKLSNPAYNFVKFLKEAGWSINHLIEWGLFAMGSMIGQSISACILLFVFDLEIVDYVVLPIAIMIAVYIIRKLQKLLTDRQQENRELEEKNTDLEQLKAMKLQNGDITANEICNFLLKPVLYDNRFVRPLYNYIGCTLDVALELVALAYAIYLSNDRAFVAKLVLIHTISSALNSVTHFMSQYNRYCNQYLQYRKHFDQPLEYDEFHKKLPIPKKGLHITDVSIPIGKNNSIQGGEVLIQLGTHILIRGESGTGKTSLMEAIRGFKHGVTLSEGVPGNYSHEIRMHAQDSSSLVQTTSISIADLFETNDENDFVRIRELLDMLFPEAKLKQILDNISKEKPFQTKINGKLSGGEKARFCIANTLFEIEKRESKIAIFDEPESALDSKNRVAILQKLFAYFKERNITAIWITHMPSSELNEPGIIFDGGKLLLVAREDGTGADIQLSQ
jgi:putative ABC transport system ATP-binding protein